MTKILQRNVRLIAQFSVLLCLAAFVVVTAAAADAGRIKVARGTAEIERGGARLPATVGMAVRVGDTVVAGDDGAVGIAFQDDSLLSIGPNSVLAIDRFVFDANTHRGEFDASLKRGTLTAVSGKLVKERPESMRVNTPAAVMAVRGTQFAVKVSNFSGK
ncbi:MAG TPA: FecR domain-containing protein [Burkholderiales bacterium]|jgi:hypothetical protein|nr:FecR domain-containing protein [Burkholderiales bacterium]